MNLTFQEDTRCQLRSSYTTGTVLFSALLNIKAAILGGTRGPARLSHTVISNEWLQKKYKKQGTPGVTIRG